MRKCVYTREMNEKQPKICVSHSVSLCLCLSVSIALGLRMSCGFLIHLRPSLVCDASVCFFHG